MLGALIALIALRCCWLALEMPWGIGAVAVFAHAAVDFPFQRPPLMLAVLLVLVVMEVEHSDRRSRCRISPGWDTLGSKR